jgi:hypothetical protein
MKTTSTTASTILNQVEPKDNPKEKPRFKTSASVILEFSNKRIKLVVVLLYLLRLGVKEL